MYPLSADLNTKLLANFLKMEYFRLEFNMRNHYTRFNLISWQFVIPKITQVPTDAMPSLIINLISR